MELYAHEPLNRRFRLGFFLDLIALEYLCHAESLIRLETTVEAMNLRNRRNFLRGYRLAVATPLNSLLGFIVGNAHSLGLEYDDRLNHWLVGGSRENGGLSCPPSPILSQIWPVCVRSSMACSSPCGGRIRDFRKRPQRSKSAAILDPYSGRPLENLRLSP